MARTSGSWGVGIDIEHLDRFAGRRPERDGGFLERVFSPKEIEYCFSRKPAAPHLAARFAAKEAVTKALANLGYGPIDYRDIEVRHDARGVPVLRLNHKTARNVELAVSLAHCADHAIAVVTAAKRSAPKPAS